MLKLLSSLVGLFLYVVQWISTEKLTKTGEALQKGKQDEKTLSDVQKAQAARARDNDSLDDELRLD